MRPDPLVSVVLPVRNGAEYLAVSLRSLLQQTLTDFEVIVVENGSTDSTPAIIAEFVDRDARFRMVRLGEVGLVAALNHGFELARAGTSWRAWTATMSPCPAVSRHRSKPSRRTSRSG